MTLHRDVGLWASFLRTDQNRTGYSAVGQKSQQALRETRAITVTERPGNQPLGILGDQ